MSSIDETTSQERDAHHTSVRDVVNDILRLKGEPTVDSLSEDLSLSDDLGFESLDLADLTVRLEDRHGVDVFADGVVDTIGEVLTQLRSA
jgi:acyl carrier protein